ncbi:MULTISPECIES: hypothetical protein [Mycetocola]|uniref:hypothetical protein n=1 Tax=Mycetocola TaxID=76634 RepID=UPI0011C45FA0|nr:hypothetical protein [Mycetocola lacteus]
MSAHRRPAQLGAIGVLSLLLLAGCAVHDEATEPHTPGPGPLPSGEASSSPGTETENPADEHEAVLVLASVDVDGKNVSVSGYVTGIIEDNGSCTYELTNDEGVVQSVERTGVADRASTSCGVGQVPIEKLPSGSWKARLVYKPVDSAAQPVTSAVETVEVP